MRSETRENRMQPCPIFLVTAVVIALNACGSTAPSCVSNADCASGVCQPDGNCASADAGFQFGDTSVKARGDASAAVDVENAVHPDASTTDGISAEGDVAATDSAAPPSDSGGICIPNHDNTITRSEVPLIAGVSATWAVAANATVDVAGKVQGDGTLQWNLADGFVGDHALKLQTLPVAATWFAPSYPTATYAAKLREGIELLGIFEATPQKLLLLGVVSPTDGLTRTQLVYTPPVPVFSFPLTVGASWTQASSVSGLAQGLGVIYAETYSFSVDAHGTLKTPLGPFPVLRVRSKLDRLIGLLPSQERSVLFVAECFGTVAAIDAVTGETADNFTKAASVRRIAP